MKIFDLHNDFLTAEKGNNKQKNNQTSEVIYALWTTRSTAQKVNGLVNSNKNAMLAIEDCGIFYNDFSIFSRAPFKYAGLTWNGYNGLAGGALTDDSLTLRGSTLIELLNSLSVPIDTAHLNRKSFFEVAERADRIICSHTCFDAVYSHVRNLTYEQISVIIEKGGIVGLCFVGDFLGEQNIQAVIRHIDWFLSSFGASNLAIGTDFYGTDKLPRGLSSYSDFDKLVLAMIRLGYSDDVIGKILYGNAAAYFKSKEVTQ